MKSWSTSQLSVGTSYSEDLGSSIIGVTLYFLEDNFLGGQMLLSNIERNPLGTMEIRNNK